MINTKSTLSKFCFFAILPSFLYLVLFFTHPIEVDDLHYLSQLRSSSYNPFLIAPAWSYPLIWSFWSSLKIFIFDFNPSLQIWIDSYLNILLVVCCCIVSITNFCFRFNLPRFKIGCSFIVYLLVSLNFNQHLSFCAYSLSIIATLEVLRLYSGPYLEIPRPIRSLLLAFSIQAVILDILASLYSLIDSNVRRLRANSPNKYNYIAWSCTLLPALLFKFRFPEAGSTWNFLPYDSSFNFPHIYFFRDRLMMILDSIFYSLNILSPSSFQYIILTFIIVFISVSIARSSNYFSQYILVLSAFLCFFCLFNLSPVTPSRHSLFAYPIFYFLLMSPVLGNDKN